FEAARVERNSEHATISDGAEQAITLREAGAETGMVEEFRRRQLTAEREDACLCCANVGCRHHEDDGVSSGTDVRPGMHGELAAHGIRARQGVDTATVRRNAENSVACRKDDVVVVAPAAAANGRRVGNDDRRATAE